MTEINDVLVSKVREIIELVARRAEAAVRINVNITLAVDVVNTRAPIRHLVPKGIVPHGIFDADGFMIPYVDEIFADWGNGRN